MNRRRAFTLIEVLAITLTMLLLVIVLIPSVKHAKRARSQRCFNNLRQVGLSFKTWPQDGDQFPAKIQLKQGGAKEALEAGQVFFNFLVMSNELSTPDVLVCPWDTARKPSSNFGTGFSDTNVSYFVGLEAEDFWPQVILSGDRNLAFSMMPLGHGLFPVTTNTVLTWTKDIHRACGNILLSDGSISMTDQAQLAAAIRNQGINTNRLAIP